MHWEIVKKAWAMARNGFPDIDRLYVDVPERFASKGECEIFDLSSPSRPIGKLSYRAAVVVGVPAISIEMDGSTAQADVPRAVLAGLRPESSVQPLAKFASIEASDIMERYPDPAVLGRQVAALAVGHEDGLRGPIGDGELRDWIVARGFPASITGHVRDGLEALGVGIESRAFNRSAKIPRKHRFELRQKVRVVDPVSNQLNECGLVMEYKRFGGDDLYLVLVDGSSQPAWYAEWQLDENSAGATP